MSEEGISWDILAMKQEMRTELNMLTARHELQEISDEAYEVASLMLQKVINWR